MFTYEINGKRYVQRPLVLGQLKQLTEVLKGLAWTSGTDLTDIIALVGGRLPSALAVVLTEEGALPGKKDIPSLAKELEDALDADTAIKVVEDFFTSNPVASLLERLRGLAGKMTKTGEKPSSAFSRQATSRRGTPYSGVLPSRSASRI